MERRLVRINSDECLEATKKTKRQLIYIKYITQETYPDLFVKNDRLMSVDLDVWEKRREDLLEESKKYIDSRVKNDKDLCVCLKASADVYSKISTEVANRKYRGDKNWTINSVLSDALSLLLKENS